MDGKKPQGIRFGYALSSEEHAPNDLVRYAARAEEVGFTFALISDHFHPWVSKQGHSPFVWSVLGAIAHATERLRIGTGVTAPIQRMHPAIVAHAAATTAAMMPGRFFLGVGSGENLNEHVTGEPWPPADIRIERLAEAIMIMRMLFTGDEVTHRGAGFLVEDARLYTLPPEPPEIMVAAKGDMALDLAGRLGDGLITVGNNREALQKFEEAGGRGKPKMVQTHVCWAEDVATARRTVHEYWPNSGLPGNLNTELATPSLFEQACELVDEERATSTVTCGPHLDTHLQPILEMVRSGFDHIYIHQVGPDQEAFFRFAEGELLPALRRELEPAVAS